MIFVHRFMRDSILVDYSNLKFKTNIPFRIELKEQLELEEDLVRQVYEIAKQQQDLIVDAIIKGAAERGIKLERALFEEEERTAV